MCESEEPLVFNTTFIEGSLGSRTSPCEQSRCSQPELPPPPTTPGFSQILASAARTCLQKSCCSRLPAPISLQSQRLLKENGGAEFTASAEERLVQSRRKIAFSPLAKISVIL